MEKSLVPDLNWRYATRSFDPSLKVSESDFNDLIESMRLAPSSFGLQPWKFLVIENPELRAKLREKAWGQAQVTDASHFIVLCARTDVDADFVKHYVDEIVSIRGIPRESLEAYEKMMLDFVNNSSKDFMVNWAKRQAYISLGVLLTAAAYKKIDASPMEGFDASEFDKILELDKDNLTSAVICALGYRVKDDPAASYKKVRFSKDEVVEFR